MLLKVLDYNHLPIEIKGIVKNYKNYVLLIGTVQYISDPILISVIQHCFEYFN